MNFISYNGEVPFLITIDKETFDSIFTLDLDKCKMRDGGHALGFNKNYNLIYGINRNYNSVIYFDKDGRLTGFKFMLRGIIDGEVEDTLDVEYNIKSNVIMICHNLLYPAQATSVLMNTNDIDITINNISYESMNALLNKIVSNLKREIDFDIIDDDEAEQINNTLDMEKLLGI